MQSKLDTFLTPVRKKRSRSSPELIRQVKKTQTAGSDSEDSTGNSMSDEQDMEVGKLSVNDLMKRMSELIDMKDLATKADVRELSAEVTTLRTEQLALNTKVNKLVEENAAMQAKIIQLEDLSRKSNLLFKNIGRQNEDPNQAVSDFCREVLQMKFNALSIVYARFLKKEADYNLILAEFADVRDISEILKRTGRLRGTKYSIQKDYSEETRRLRNQLFEIRRIIKRECPELRIDVRPGSVWIDTSPYYLDIVKEELVGKTPGSAETMRWNELLRKAGFKCMDRRYVGTRKQTGHSND